MITIPIEISARHVHLTTADWQRLFGVAAITPDRPISQAPQFLARERVTIQGPKGELPEIGIVGPFRSYTQVELAASDARRLGLTPPLTDSGSLERAVPITLIGPTGSVTLPVAIIQQRHLHAAPAEAAQLGLHDRQEVAVHVDSNRGGVLEHVLVRVDPSFSLRLHLDMDEGNALDITADTHATLV